MELKKCILHFAFAVKVVRRQGKLSWEDSHLFCSHLSYEFGQGAKQLVVDPRNLIKT